MDYFIICIVAFLASGLTFFSGFGLGTILLPAFVLFFPLETAISITAIVHFLNNLFKLTLTAKNANSGVVVKFGLPSMIAAIGGALLLTYMVHASPLFTYELSGKTYEVMTIKLIIAFLMIAFALLDLIPAFSQITFGEKFMVTGGLFSGFFGGLSGHQGALRSMFLIRSGLSKEGFIATGIVIACMVDVSRLAIYGTNHFGITQNEIPIVAAGTVSAFAGALLGNKLVKKVTLKSIQFFVAAMLIMFAVLLGLGII
ncbi:MAG: hypothetical protein POELPBGB_02076 [Bacteroidia bacterium]|nr:hypothetical protein [Bacteroidia bacterium]